MPQDGQITNQQRLQVNKEQTKFIARSYLAQHENIIVAGELEARQKECFIGASKQILQLVQSGKSSYKEIKSLYADAIFLLKERVDNLHGVSWYIEPHQDGTQDLVRDGRDAIIPQNLPESYMMQFLNLSRAAELLLDQAMDSGAKAADLAKIRQEIRDMALQVLAKLDGDQRQSINEKEIKRLNTMIINKLKAVENEQGNCVFVDAKASLNVAKEIVGLDDEHYHVTTISTVIDAQNKKHIVTESAVMNLGFTDAQKSQLKVVKASKPGEVVGIEWYDKLTMPEQKLVLSCIDRLLAENCVIPTQLRDILPGIRNSYTKIISLDGKVLLETMHSASLSFHGRGANNLNVTIENIKQLQSFTEKPIVLNSLNSSNSKYFGDHIDSEIIRQIEAAAKSLSINYNLSPLNPLRLLGAHTEHQHYKKALKLLGGELVNLPAISNFLQNGEKRFFFGLFSTKQNSRAAHEELEKISGNDSDMNVYLRHAIEAKSLLEHKFLVFGRHTNLEIVAKMKIVSYRFSAWLENTFCKSGKDRTGVQEFHTTDEVVSYELGLTKAEYKAIRAANIQKLANAQHTQFIAEGQGGTVGARGVRLSIKHWVPAQYKKIKGLAQKSSEFSTVKTAKLR